ncbi:hypothetical protein EHW65_18255 [Erwinia psidii]|uniref:hypothetical protein n=1 Tax=Erwinia psidii TaxID=69224 RepID=UPI00226B476F|nr:hypothetical protein [Erwinia psidii]MCX8959103.1 hypothetical protein [Erwinia psidii]
MIIEQYASDYLGNLNQLSDEKKLVIGLCNLARHMKSVQQFDGFYNESLSDEFTKILKGFLDYIQGVKSTLVGKDYIQSVAPDTDDYPDTEGTIAQNAFGAAYYLHSYLVSNDNQDFLRSLDKAFESTDALKYDKGTTEEEDEYFSLEAKKLEKILFEVKNTDSFPLSSIEELMNFARTVPLD